MNVSSECLSRIPEPVRRLQNKKKMNPSNSCNQTATDACGGHVTGWGGDDSQLTGSELFLREGWGSSK